MAVSRRTFLGSALAASGLVALSGKGFAYAQGSAPGDVVGKITVGYQGWFACQGDAAPIDGWWHWSNDWSRPPASDNKAIVAWPDMSEYTASYQTAFGPLGSGAPAKLFSSYDQQTVDTHFRWMRENGCDTAALQRFNPFGGEGPTRDDMAGKVRSAAEANGVKFYIMYDVTGWASMQSEIKTDWTTKMSAHVASSAYAHQNGKPVVCIWGFGLNDVNHPWDAATCLDVVNWFKSQGCYVIGGVPREWRLGTGGSRPGYADVYHAFDMLSPWMVGAIGTVADSDWMYTNLNVPDEADCAAHGIDYQPCVLPGDVSGRQRAHGDFMWRQFYNMIRAGAQGIYISMFDEFNEGNQIAKTAATAADAPAGFLTLDEDGTACSSDYYLRLTGDGGRMLKGELALTPVRPTPPTVGGPTGDRAAGRPTAQSSQTQDYGSANVVDGNPATYWESANGAFPQWIQVDLGSAVAVGRVVLTLPPSWEARTEGLSIVDGASGAVLASATDHRFDPASGNTVTVTAPGTSVRYLRIVVSANTGWPAAQLSGLQVFS